jgi:hypothetical protein
MLRVLVEQGAANDQPRLFSLSKGVAEYIAAASQTRCWVILLDNIDAAVTNQFRDSAQIQSIGVVSSAEARR